MILLTIYNHSEGRNQEARKTCDQQDSKTCTTAEKDLELWSSLMSSTVFTNCLWAANSLIDCEDLNTKFTIVEITLKTPFKHGAVLFNAQHAWYNFQQTTFWNIYLIFPIKQESTFHANCLIYMKCQILFAGKNKRNIKNVVYWDL